jgi:hypothetical protein
MNSAIEIRLLELPNPAFLTAVKATTIFASAVHFVFPRRRHLQLIRFLVHVMSIQELALAGRLHFGSFLNTHTTRYGSMEQGRWQWWPSGPRHILIGLPTELTVRVYVRVWLTYQPELLSQYRNPANYFIQYLHAGLSDEEIE